MSAYHDKSVNAALERQMRNWEIARQQTAGHEEPVIRTQPFITVSRMVGSGGSDLARRIAAALHWPLFDRELMLHMAGDDHVRRQIYESLDERDLGYIEESLRVFTSVEFRRNDYFRRLVETLLALSRQGRAVFLGRGADLMLPRDHGLRIRVVAPPAVCAQRFANRSGLTPADATREIEQIERERSRFIRKHFNVEPDALDRFDLTFNLATITPEEAVQMVLNLLKLRGVLS